MQLDVDFLQDCLIAFGITPEGTVAIVEPYQEFTSLLLVCRDSPMNSLHRVDYDHLETHFYVDSILDRVNMGEHNCLADSEESQDYFTLLEPDPKKSNLLQLKSTYFSYDRYRKTGVDYLGNLFLTTETRIPSSISRKNLRAFIGITRNPIGLNCFTLGSKEASSAWFELLGSGLSGLRKLVCEVLDIQYDPRTIDCPLPFIVYECLDIEDFLTLRFSNSYEGSLERACYAQCLNLMYHLADSKLALKIPIMNFESDARVSKLTLMGRKSSLQDYEHHMFRSIIYKGDHVKQDTPCPYDMYLLHLAIKKARHIATKFYCSNFKPLKDPEELFPESELEPDRISSITRFYDFTKFSVDLKAKKVLSSGDLIYDFFMSTPQAVCNRNERVIQRLVQESNHRHLEYTRSKWSSYISGICTWLYRFSRDCLEFPEPSEYPKRSNAAKHYYQILEQSRELTLVNFRKVLSTLLYHTLNNSLHVRLDRLGSSGLQPSSCVDKMFRILLASTEFKFHSNIFLAIQNMDTTTVYSGNLDATALELYDSDASRGYDYLHNSKKYLDISVTDTITGETVSLEQLYHRALVLTHAAIRNDMEVDDATWLSNFSSVDSLLNAHKYEKMETKILGLGGFIPAKELFSSRYTPKHLKIFAYITNQIVLRHSKDGPAGPYGGQRGEKLNNFLKVCEVLGEWDTAIKIVDTLDTMVRGLLQNDGVTYKVRYYLLGTINLLTKYSTYLKDSKDQG